MFTFAILFGDEGHMLDFDDNLNGDQNIDDYDMVGDTSSTQARVYKDIQGIPWERLNITREGYKRTRLEQYLNYENIPLSREAVVKEDFKGSLFVRKPNYPCLTQKSWAIPFCGDIQGKHINFIHGNAFRLWIKKSCFTTVQSAALGTLLVITAAESVGNDVLGPAISDSQKLLRKDRLREVVKDFSGVAASKLFEQEIRELVVLTEFLINIKRDEDIENFEKLLAEEECILGARIY
ncbi:hypothetical protein Tco_1368803 [Tanacetum coccineum]